MNSPSATTQEGESPNNETIQTNTITLLVGPSETRFVVHESSIHRSPVLQERCCGSLHDASDPDTIRLPSDNPDHFAQMLEALHTQELHIRPDFGDPPCNWFTTTTTTTAELPPPHIISKASLRRSQCAITNLSQVYALAQKYEIVEVQALALRKLTYYLSPAEFPEGFLWQLAMMYEGTPGAEGVLVPFLQKALAQVKKRGEGEGIVGFYGGLESEFGRWVREGFYGE